ncbi:MAG: hypothetical protein CL610_23425 [Anaerolineaceae bacterium]|nr:hypothetical protein [Anaerolineaceae bacterium]
MFLAISLNQPIWGDVMALCPTCQTRTRFSYAGEQRWPRHVAEAAGLEPVVRLWHCQRCRTTISECDLHQ